MEGLEISSGLKFSLCVGKNALSGEESHGILVICGSDIIKQIEDLSDESETVKAFVDRLNKHQPEICHIEQIIENHLS